MVSHYSRNFREILTFLNNPPIMTFNPHSGLYSTLWISIPKLLGIGLEQHWIHHISKVSYFRHRLTNHSTFDSFNLSVSFSKLRMNQRPLDSLWTDMAVLDRHALYILNHPGSKGLESNGESGLVLAIRWIPNITEGWKKLEKTRLAQKFEYIVTTLLIQEWFF